MTPWQRRLEDLGIIRVRWPHSALQVDPGMRRRLVKWAEENRLRLGDGRCHHWLTAQGPCTFDCPDWKWLDHISTWTDRHGVPALLVAHNYGITDGDIAYFAELTAHGFNVEVNGEGWYGHGSQMIEVRRA